jgi:O-antigen ligase
VLRPTIGSLKISFPATGYLLLAFISYCGLFVLMSDNPARGLVSLRPFLAALITLYITLKAIENESQLRSFYLLLIVWGISLSFLILFAVISEGSLDAQFYQKGSYLSWGRSNYLATFLVLLTPISLSISFVKRIPMTLRFFSLIATTIMLISLFLTGSRGGVLAFCMSFLVLLLKIVRVRTFIYLILFLTIFFLILIYNPATFLILTGIFEFEKETSVFLRLIAWKQAWHTFSQNTIFGVGLGNIGFYLPSTNPEVTTYAKVHNLPLQLLSETGIIGFLLYLVVLYRIFKIQIFNCIKQGKEFLNYLSWGILAGTIGVLSHAMIEPSLTGYQMLIILWIVIGMSVKKFILTGRPIRSATKY